MEDVKKPISLDEEVDQMIKEDIAQEVLSALKAADILERIKQYLKSSGENVPREKLLDIIYKGEEADEYYTQPDN